METKVFKIARLSEENEKIHNEKVRQYFKMLRDLLFETETDFQIINRLGEDKDMLPIETELIRIQNLTDNILDSAEDEDDIIIRDEILACIFHYDKIKKESTIMVDNVYFYEIDDGKVCENFKTSLPVPTRPIIFRIVGRIDNVMTKWKRYLKILTTQPQAEAAKRKKGFMDLLLCDENKKDAVIAKLNGDVCATKNFIFLVQALIDIGLLEVLDNIGGGKKGLHDAFSEKFGDEKIYSYSKFSDGLKTQGYNDNENNVINRLKKEYTDLLK